MAHFKYVALSRDGVRVSGIAEGYNELDAASRIKESCDVILKLTEVKERRSGLLSMDIGGNRLNGKAFTVMCSQFANTMAAMMGAGLTMDKAVSITSKVIDNYHLSWQTGKLAEQLESGHGLGTSMRELTDYPDILIDMADVGEGSGEMERTLSTIAQYYDAELDEATRSALAKLEPALLIGLAAIAGFIVVAIYMAIFSLYGSLGNL